MTFDGSHSAVISWKESSKLTYCVELANV